MLLDAEFWVAVAFVLFMGVVWKVGGFAQITKALDTRGRRVRSELDEAPPPARGGCHGAGRLQEAPQPG